MPAPEWTLNDRANACRRDWPDHAVDPLQSAGPGHCGGGVGLKPAQRRFDLPFEMLPTASAKEIPNVSVIRRRLSNVRLYSPRSTDPT
ncbi:unnamed protein product [marine sediment metagenome]|uniref:Uncharacterized protein n=1 Tax=marine sediment metagenome TaxID=412755 RepID=X0XR49_9ZZZZ